MAADLGFSPAAIASEKVDQPAKTGDVGAVADCSAVPLRDDQAGAGEYSQVVRHRIVRHVAVTRDLSREKAVRIDRQQPPQCLQPCGLTKGRESLDRRLGEARLIHDLLNLLNTLCRYLPTY